MIVFSNNKTAKWLSEKTQAEQSKLVQRAGACGPELYQARKKRLLEERADILRTKQAALKHLQEKRVQEKEKLTQMIMIYGLWPMAANAGRFDETKD